jgi:4-amino-4-deoxy-L-arabinose transferase-like glycosyltransferase
MRKGAGEALRPKVCFAPLRLCARFSLFICDRRGRQKVLQAQLRQIALAAAVAALVMLTNLGGPRLWDRDEPRNAQCAREMLQRADWVVPTFNDELRTHKPVLLYWCIMSSYLALGVTEFAARLPSALCAIGTVICVYRMGRRLFGPQAGVWAGVALGTSLMFVVAGRAATPDSLLIFCSTLALTIYVCGTFQPRFETTPADAPPQAQCGPLAARVEKTAFNSQQAAIPLIADLLPQPLKFQHLFPHHWLTVLGMYAAMGLGILAKGPVGLVLPTAVLGMFLLVTRLPESAREQPLWRSVLATFDPIHFLKTCWAMRPVTAIFAAMAVALPWYWAVGLATDGEFLRGFFFEHNLSRATSSMENHSGTIFFYPLTLLVGFFPWSIFAVPLAIDTALQMRRRDRFHPGYLLCVCWIGVYVAIFSIARTKLPSYVTPCYPALALLVGDYIDRWSRQRAAVAGGWLTIAFTCLGLVGIGVAVGVPLAAKRLMPGEEWLGLIGLVPLAGCVVCLGFLAVRSYFAAAGTLGMTAIAFATLLFAVGVERVDRHQTNHALLDAIFSRSSQPHIASYSILEPSWVFYGGQAIHEFADNPQIGRGYAASQAVNFLTENPDHFLITTAKKFRDLSPHLPLGIGIIEQAPYFMRRGQELVVVGPLTRRPMQPPVSRRPGMRLIDLR